MRSFLEIIAVCQLAKEDVVAYYTNMIAVAAVLRFLLPSSPAAAQVPDVITAPNATKILEVHAEGAQIYACKAGKDGKLVWQFREPVAALILDGKTIGRQGTAPEPAVKGRMQGGRGRKAAACPHDHDGDQGDE